MAVPGIANQIQRPALPQQQKAALETPERLQKDLNPPSPQRLGLRPIEQYDYLNVARDRIDRKAVPLVKENIQKIKNSCYEYYFLDNRNPFVAQVQLNGQILWKAIAVCRGSDVEEIGNILTLQNQSVHVNTGNHGRPQGMIPTDGDFFLANELHEPAFFNEDTKAFNHIPGKVSFLQISAEVRPIYPKQANHVIDGWCWSFRTLFTDIKNHLIPKDLNGDFIPTLFKDVVTHQIMNEPMYSPECGVIHGRTHYYDRETVESLIDLNADRMDVVGLIPTMRRAYDDVFRRESNILRRGLGERDPNKLMKCRLAECGKIIHISTFLFDPQLKEEIVLHKRTLENVRILKEKDLENAQKINTLQQDVLTKDQEIAKLNVDVVQLEQANIGLTLNNTHLTAENATKDQTIVGLQGRVTVEIAEKQQLKQEKIEALLQQEAIAREKRILRQESALVVKKQQNVIGQLEQGLRPQDLQEVNEMTIAFQNTFIQEPQAQVKVRERVALMELGDFSMPLNMPVFVKNAQKRITVTNELLKELKNFNGLLKEGWIYQKTPFVKKGETQPIDFFEKHVHVFRRYITEVVRSPYNTIVQEASCHLLFNLDREAPLYKDILKITYETPLIKVQRNLQSTDLLWRELENTLETVHEDFYSVLKDNQLKLKTPTRQDCHVVSSQIIRHEPEVMWEQQEKEMTEIAVISSKTYATKLSEILSRLMAIRWCEENNRLLDQFLNSCM